jgi:hypothetical protein
MEGLRRRRDATLALHREFTDSRLERQILIRAFALLVPIDGSGPMVEQPGKADADPSPVIASRSQGVPLS